MKCSDVLETEKASYISIDYEYILNKNLKKKNEKLKYFSEYIKCLELN